MTPAEIVIAACLAAAPLLVGLQIGRFLARCYGLLNDRGLALSYETLHRRKAVMVVFWTALGGVVGGFASGVFVQRVLDLISYIS